MGAIVVSRASIPRPESLVLFVLLLAAISAARLQGQPPAKDLAPGEQLDVVEHVLENGMTFLILERPRSPVVSIALRFPVGSADETLGMTGISHVAEHMYFKGTEEIGTRDARAERALLDASDLLRDSMIMELGAFSPDSARIKRLRRESEALEDDARSYEIEGEFYDVYAAAGARNLNATTSLEATTFVVELPVNRLELWFAVESDRFSRPFFRALFSELDVVLEERRTRIDASPDALLREAFLAQAFTRHPYGVPVIGYPEDISALTRPRLQSFARAHFGVGGAVAAIVGGVSARDAIRWAEEYFGSLPAGAVPPRPWIKEPPQLGQRRVVVERAAQPRLLMGWRVPGAMHPDGPALTVLASLLAGGRASPLYRTLVLEERAAVSASAFLGPGLLAPRLLTVGLQAREPSDAAQLEALALQVIDSVLRAPVDSAQLRRVLNQLSAGEYRRLASNLELAGRLADSKGHLGDWREIFRIHRKALRVTPEEVERAARAYLVDRTRTTALLKRPPPS